MSAELGDWLAELCTSEPASAAEVGAAITAIMDADDPMALALVGVPAAERVDPREELDELYQSMLEALHHVRRVGADAATTRVGAERLLAELGSDSQPDPAVQSWLKQARDKAKRQEAAIAKRNQRLQSEVDRFRTAKETSAAMYTAAEASLRIHAAVEAATGEGLIGAETTTRYPGPTGRRRRATTSLPSSTAHTRRRRHSSRPLVPRPTRHCATSPTTPGSTPAARRSARASRSPVCSSCVLTHSGAISACYWRSSRPTL